MKSEITPAADTRQRLLDAATGTFAEQGFRNTTIARICRSAHANIAAVNYYFGSKEALYREAWLHAHRRTVELFPPDGGVPPCAPPEQRLEGRIRALLQRALSEDGLEFRIMSHEIAVPTGLLEQVIQDTIGPLRKAMESLVRELLGGVVDEQDVRLCVLCVIGPCMQMIRRHQMRKHTLGAERFDADTIEATVRHFTSFALAGINEIRRQ